MNTIIIHGRLTRDPEERDYDTKKGKSKMASFTVACDRRYGEDADFFDCTVFGDKRADLIATHFHKGQEILVSGEMTSRRVEKDGATRVYWTINVEQFDFCGSKQDSLQQLTEDIPF